MDNADRTLYICDLHFNPGDITKHKTKIVLKKDAFPKLGYKFIFHRDEKTFMPIIFKSIFYISSQISSETDNQPNGFEEFEFLTLVDGDESSQIQNELKTIPLQEYKDLVQLIPKLEKLKCVNKKLESVIKSKDMKLQELMKAHVIDRKKYMNISHLSIVSILCKHEIQPNTNIVSIIGTTKRD